MADDLTVMLGNPGVQPGVMGAAGGAVLWPKGVGIADRAADPDSCSCPPMARCFPCCCALPGWFRDRYMKDTGAEFKQKRKCLSDGWVAEDVDVLRQKAKLEAMIPCPPFACGAESCCEPEVHYVEGSQLVGKAVFKFVMCAQLKCDDYVMVEGKDSNGKVLFERIGASCCRRAEWRGESLRGNWLSFAYPVYHAGTHANAQAEPVTYLNTKYHAHPMCPMPVCRPLWIGIDQMPAGMSPEHQKVLIAMVGLRWTLGGGFVGS